MELFQKKVNRQSCWGENGWVWEVISLGVIGSLQNSKRIINFELGNYFAENQIGVI